MKSSIHGSENIAFSSSGREKVRVISSTQSSIDREYGIEYTGSYNLFGPELCQTFKRLLHQFPDDCLA